MNPNLSILYRDQWMVAIDKPTGVLVHSGDDPNTIAPNAMKLLRDQLKTKIATVHRLDCPTSGVLLYSLSDQLSPHIRQLFEIDAVEKRYYAIVVGETPDSWVCNQCLQKELSEVERSAETHFVRKSITTIEGQAFSLLSVRPITGRYHQIRKHLVMSGFPIVGDYRYGDEAVNKQVALIMGSKEQMLHAYQLVLSHPVTSEELIINAPMPDRFSFMMR